MIWRLLVRITPFAIGLIAVAIVLGSVYVDMQDTSPGRISAVHAQVPELLGSENCAACHGQPGQSMASACLACHGDIGTQLSDQKGFHGQISTDLVADCAKCHSEHHGEEFPITSNRSFVLAGVTDPRLFQHQGLDFHLIDKHLSVGCEKCHTKAQVKLLALGEKRFLGLSQNCTSCHKDVHDGSYGHDCASCHGQQHPFPQAAEFEHTLAFSLVGTHGKVACAACHQRDSPNSVTALFSNRLPTNNNSLSVRTCRVCHESPHNEQFLALVSQKLNIDSSNSCQHCHPAVHETFVGTKVAIDPSLHACTGFMLDAPHNKLTCVACHAGFGKPKLQLSSFRQSYPGRNPDDCRACHKDPHQGQFELGPFRGASCLTCHERHTFMPAAFTLNQHKQTRFPLVGAHSNADCNQCHVLTAGEEFRQLTKLAVNFNSTAETGVATLLGFSESDGTEPTQVRVFHGTPTSCKGCHNDPHLGQFEQGPFRGNDCRACHDEHSFRRPTFTIKQHSKTQFSLTGAHTAVACSSCHKLPGEELLVPWNSKPSPHNPKLVNAINQSDPKQHVGSIPEQHLDRNDVIQPRIFHGTPSQCSECHADVHHGQFDQPHLPANIEGKTGCARCHTTESFRKIRAQGFDHALWTSYELRGAHARAKCADCHSRSQVADTTDRSFGRVTSRNCQSCHTDPHVGQFGPTTKVNCTQCHAEGNSFRELVFDHQRDSRFRLDRDHTNLTCSACHKRQRLSDGRTAIRYKPLGILCGDCHLPQGSRPASTRPRP